MCSVALRAMFVCVGGVGGGIDCVTPALFRLLPGVAARRRLCLNPTLFHTAAPLSPQQVEAGGERLQLRNLGAVTQRNAHLLVINVFNTEV